MPANSFLMIVLDGRRFDYDDMQSISPAVLSTGYSEMPKDSYELDFAYSVADLSQSRCNAFQ